MRKVISLLLMLSMLASLTGCKSQEAKNVEALINSIGEVTMENISVVEEVAKAYDALSEDDKEKVENIAVLEEAQELAEKLVFENGLGELASRLRVMSASADFVTDCSILVWKNVGADQFYVTMQMIWLFEKDQSRDAYVDELSEIVVKLSTRQAAKGLEPSMVKNNEISVADQEEILESCILFNEAYAALSYDMDSLTDDVTAFCKEYKETYPEPISILYEWGIDCGIYADFALEPTGTLSSYGSAAEEHQDKMDKYERQLEFYY